MSDVDGLDSAECKAYLAAIKNSPEGKAFGLKAKSGPLLQGQNRLGEFFNAQALGFKWKHPT